MSIKEKIDAIRACKENIKEALINKGATIKDTTPFSEYAVALEDIPSGGGDFLAVSGSNAVWNPDFTWDLDCKEAKNIQYGYFGKLPVRTVKGANITNIGNSAFQSCYSLTTVSFPQCVSISASAFAFCSGLAEVSFPQCTFIGSCAFQGCSSLSNASFPQCSSVSNSAFISCSHLQSVYFPSCTILEVSVFAECKRLNKVEMPELKSIYSYAFCNCVQLTASNINAPNITSIYSSAFKGCYNISASDFPNANYIASNAFESDYTVIQGQKYGTWFNDNRGLEYIDFPTIKTLKTSAFAAQVELKCVKLENCTTIEGSAFTSCRCLASLYLLGSTVATLSHTNAFERTPISDYTIYVNGIRGSIFVRASLLEDWKAKTNWVTYSNRFVGLTDEEIAELGA